MKIPPRGFALIALTVALGLGLAFFGFRSRQETVRNIPAQVSAAAISPLGVDPAAAPSAPPVQAGAFAVTKRASTPPAPAAQPAPHVPAPRFEAGTATQSRAAMADPELLAVRGMLRDYRATFGQNPTGTNREITRVLLGNNPRGVRFNFSSGANAGAPRLDDRGRLLDRWERPYFFHQISGTALEVRSAGPDGVMWTADDEVTR